MGLYKIFSALARTKLVAHTAISVDLDMYILPIPRLYSICLRWCASQCFEISHLPEAR